MKEVRKTIVVAALAAAFLNLEARLPVGHLVVWLAGLAGYSAAMPG